MKLSLFFLLTVLSYCFLNIEGAPKSSCPALVSLRKGVTELLREPQKFINTAANRFIVRASKSSNKEGDESQGKNKSKGNGKSESESNGKSGGKSGGFLVKSVLTPIATIVKKILTVFNSIVTFKFPNGLTIVEVFYDAIVYTTGIFVNKNSLKTWTEFIKKIFTVIEDIYKKLMPAAMKFVSRWAK